MTTRLKKLSARPSSDTVRPLGTPRRKEKEPKVPPFVKTAAYATVPEDPKQSAPWIHGPKEDQAGVYEALGQLVQKIEAQKVVDTPSAGEVSLQNQDDSQPVTPANQEKTMNPTIKSLNKNGKRAIIDGAAASFQIPLAAFKVAPTAGEPFSLDMLKEKEVKQPAVKLSAEERKAARAAKPKPTLAEKIASREAALAKLKAQATGVNASM